MVYNHLAAAPALAASVPAPGVASAGAYEAVLRVLRAA